MDPIPCDKLRAEQGPRCYLGWNTALDCTGCCAYAEDPDPSPRSWQVWNDLRSGGATRSAGDNNPGGLARS